MAICMGGGASGLMGMGIQPSRKTSDHVYTHPPSTLPFYSRNALTKVSSPVQSSPPPTIPPSTLFLSSPKPRFYLPLCSEILVYFDICLLIYLKTHLCLLISSSLTLTSCSPFGIPYLGFLGYCCKC
ncbi:hypothetical protein V6N13_098453 [Hibiscus sabdariffa]